jgi:leader peptidase (prepilin peptidase)/N-methyltransferase
LGQALAAFFSAKRASQSPRFPKASFAAFAALGAATGYFAQRNASSPYALAALAMAALALASAAAFDLALKIIPNFIPIALLLGRVALFLAELAFGGPPAARLLDSVIGLAASASLLLVSSKLAKGGVGAGDVKLFGALGFMCGLRAALSTLLAALILASLVGLALLALKKKGAKDSVPFAPFAAAGFSLSVALAMV